MASLNLKFIRELHYELFNIEAAINIHNNNKKKPSPDYGETANRAIQHLEDTQLALLKSQRDLIQKLIEVYFAQ